MKCLWPSLGIFLLFLQLSQSRPVSDNLVRFERGLTPDTDTILTAIEIDQLRDAARGGSQWNNFVYRGDARPPQVVINDGGFVPISKTPTGYGLFDHVTAKDLDNSVFVSTTEKLHRGAFYAKNSLNHPAHKGKTVSYIYKIETWQRNFADVNRSLRLRYGSSNLEHVGLGHIPWTQVHSYAEVTLDELDELEAGTMRTEEIVFKDNVKYEAVDKPGSLPRAQLAGWPENHPAWQKFPWEKLRKDNGGKPLDVEKEYFKLRKLCKRDGAGCFVSAPELDGKPRTDGNARKSKTSTDAGATKAADGFSNKKGIQKPKTVNFKTALWLHPELYLHISRMKSAHGRGGGSRGPKFQKH